MNAGRIYSESSVHGASAVGLVVKMYDMLIVDLNRAVAALRAGDVEARTREVKHALEVMAQLQASINFSSVGDTANNLDTLYAIVRAKILQAHMQQSIPLFEQQIEMVSSVREAWREVDRRSQPAATPSYGDAMMPPPAADPDSIHVSNWRA